MVRRLEEVENVLAAELGFSPLLADDIIRLTVEICAGELPLICSLPPEIVLTLGPRLIDQGASAISLAPRRGALTTPLRQGAKGATPAVEVISGRLFGPGLFPLTIERVQNAAKLGLPLIAAGGIWSEADCDAALAAGALAVQIDAPNWLPPPPEDRELRL